MTSISPICKKCKTFMLVLKSPTYRDFMIKKSLKSKTSKSHTWAPLSQNRPRMSGSSLWLLEKKHFYTWCAGLIVHALLTLYSNNNTVIIVIKYVSLYMQILFTRLPASAVQTWGTDVILRIHSERYLWLRNLFRGRILGRNWGRRSFPPCYSQSPIIT